MAEIPKHNLSVVNDSIDNKSASELVEAMTSDKRLNGKDLQLVTKLQEKLGSEFESINESTSNSLNKLKEGLKESTLNMLEKGYSVENEADFNVLQSMISLSGVNIILGNNYEAITAKLEGQKNFSIVYSGEGNIQVYQYSNQKKYHNNNFTSDFGSIDKSTGVYSNNVSGNDSLRDFWNDGLGNNNEFNFNGNLDTLSNSELMESYNNIIIPVALYESPENDILHVINQDVPGSEDNIKTFIQEKLEFKENRENKNKLFSVQKQLLSTEIESYSQIEKITPALKTSLQDAFKNLQNIIITGSTQLSVIKAVITQMKNVIATYNQEIAQLIPVVNEIETDATANAEIGIEAIDDGLSSNVSDFIKNNNSLKVIDGKVYYYYSVNGKPYGNYLTIESNPSIRSNLGTDNETPCKKLGDAMSLKQWMVSCENSRKIIVKPEVKSEQDNEQEDTGIIDTVVESAGSGIDYIVEKTKALIEWADELVDGKKVGKFTGANGEEVKIQCDGTQLSIDTSWFGDDVMDYNITQSLNDIIDNKTGEPVEKSIQKLIEQYNQKVLEEAYDDINKKSRTSDVVDTVTNTDGETEKVYLKRRDSRDGEINIFIQIGDTKTKVELSEDNTYTHSDVKNKIKEAKDNYNKEVLKNTEKITEIAKNQEEKLGNINKEILALDIDKSVTELLNHKVGNKNFKTIELGAVDKGGDNIDIALRKYPDGTYRVMIDPDGFGNGESIKLEKDNFNKDKVKTTIKSLVAEFRIEK